jgi:ABC-2 type transport system ATP-binding protein
LHQGELKELGRVDALLKVRDVTELRATGLSDEAKQELQRVVEKYGGRVESLDNPTTTLEDLFLEIVQDAAARPGRRTRES